MLVDAACEPASHKRSAIVIPSRYINEGIRPCLPQSLMTISRTCSKAGRRLPTISARTTAPQSTSSPRSNSPAGKSARLGTAPSLRFALALSMRSRRDEQVARKVCWEAGRRLLCDGRNRMEAMERAGVPLPRTLALKNGSRRVCAQTIIEGDPVAYIISANIHRRHLHLTKQQQADLIVAALKAGEKPTQPELVSKGGRGNVNELKAKAVAEGAKLGISKGNHARLDFVIKWFQLSTVRTDL